MAKGGNPKGNGGKPGNGVGRFFDKALYFFEHPYRAVSAASDTVSPSDPRADINDMTPSATLPIHHKSYDPVVGGYVRFVSASSTKYTLDLDVADAQSEVFIAMLIRPRSTSNGHCLGRGTTDFGFRCYVDTDQLYFEVYTSSDGLNHDVLFTGNTDCFSGKWVLAMFAYKSGSYIKVGANGRWLNSTTITSTGLRPSTGVDAIVIGQTGLGFLDGDVAMVGIGTAIPANGALATMAQTILSGSDVPGGNSDPPGGDVPPPNPATNTGRLLLLGAG